MSTLGTYVIVLDFGYAKDATKRTSIWDLGDYVAQYCKENPSVTVLAQSETFQYLNERHATCCRRLLKITVGQSSTDGTTDGGSYHVLREAARMIDQEGSWFRDHATIFVVAHSLHVARVVRQGRLFGLNLLALPNLPCKLYTAADQWWCRNRLFWYFRELIGCPILKLKGQI